MGASSRAMSLSPMRPEGLAIPACLLHVFESFGCGVFLLDRERQLLFLNPTGVDCLGDGLTLRGKQVAAADRESDVRLPLVVHVVRLEENVQPVLRGASVLLVVFDPECCQPPPPGMLIDLFGLTPAEASVAIGIVGGRHLTEIAVDRGVKVGTVRTYSKTVFAKTRTRSQAELAALLTRLAFPIARRCDGGQTSRSVYVVSTDRDDLRKRIGRSG